MITYIKGILDEKKPDKIIVETGGIGYEVFISPYVYERLPAVYEEVKIVTYLDVREDSMKLYGFLSFQEKRLFVQLLSVSGVGPKGAMSILNVLGPDSLVAAIISGDSKSIAKANGIGKKTAEKVVLELRDRVSTEDTIFDTESSAGATAADIYTDAVSEAAQAIAVLGYSNSDALKAIRKVDVSDDMKAEDIIKQALKYL